MGREHGTSAQPWGTLEDLLLACAVNRHGTSSWDSIAMELQNRSSTTTLPLTPQYLKEKFDCIKRRFVAQKDDESDGIVDQLRRIRVEELRREVQRRDVTIVSLELKVKMMEEERERSLKEEAEKVDLKKDLGETTPLPENLAVSGDVSDDKENRSFNESNSTTQKGEGQARNGVVKDKARPEPERNEPNTGRIGSEPGNDSVMNGKVDNIDDAGTNEEKSVKKASRAGRPGELESVGESKREKEAASKQSSDVQSSASLSRKKRRRKGGGVGGSSSGEEPEGDEVSPATKRISAVKSEPLIKLLGIIRSHRLGSVFERRLRSQVASLQIYLFGPQLIVLESRQPHFVALADS
uniref:Myb-like domain-containing protein n=1 Tax=Fagus sylvatica TaxID=28930 RepID=A0A2N9EEU3_FAGSY